MKILFEKFVKALDQYAADSSSGTKSWWKNPSLTQAKLESAKELGAHFRVLISDLDNNEFLSHDYDQEIQNIERIKAEVEEQRSLWHKPAGSLDHLLVWMSECLKSAKAQSMLPLDDKISGKELSNAQRFVKKELDQFIVLLKGFQPVSDDQKQLEVWKHNANSKVILYPVKAGWDENILNKIESIAAQVECLKQATIVQLRNQEKDQVNNTLYYMTIAELSKISPVLAPLCQSLTETFDLKPFFLKQEQPAAVQEKIVKEEMNMPVTAAEEEIKENTKLETDFCLKKNIVFSPKQNAKFSDILKNNKFPSQNLLSSTPVEDAIAMATPDENGNRIRQRNTIKKD
jgi:hypothetical protein